MPFLSTLRKTPGALALVLLVLAPATSPADENLTLEKAINGIAKNVAGVAKQRNTLEIVINPITDTGDLTHTAGAGITESLISRLIAEGLKPVTRGADLIFSGEYAVGEAESDAGRLGFPVGRLTFKVKRRNGMTLIDSEAELPERQPRITSPKDLALMSGQTIFRPPSAPEVDNNKKALEAIDNKPGLFNDHRRANSTHGRALCRRDAGCPSVGRSRLRATRRSARAISKFATACRSSKSSRARPSPSGSSTTPTMTLPRPSRSTA